MKRISRFTTVIPVIYIVCIQFSVFAQVTILPIQGSEDYRKSKAAPPTSARTHAEDSTQLELPFWDDFATVEMTPDSGKWVLSTGTPVIASGIGIDAPTVNVAVFDGWNSLGAPYKSDELAIGAGDSLVSRFIDLSKVASNKRQTVFFSFFWQKEGRGEQPDEPDSLVLKFMNKSKKWIRIWGVSGTQVEETDRFFQEIIKVDTAFFDPYFQFRFQSYGRLSGGYDNWNVDYIYLNEGRNANNVAFPDRALTSIPSSFLNKYTAMPYDHFIVNVSSNLSTVKTDFYNMDSQVQPIEYSVLIRDSSKIYDQMDDLAVLDPNPGGFERRTITSKPVDPDAFDSEHDTLKLRLETVFFINSGDSVLFNNKIDYRVNDTTRSYVNLDKDLAYDDGTAEWAAGLSQRGSKLAYRFVIPKPDIITELRLYFPTFSGGVDKETITLIIWDNLNEGVEGRLLTEDHIINASGALNEYTTYKLGRSISVKDTFYVGFEQEVSSFLPIGLDKNTDSGDELFVNTDGTWVVNDKITGSLMIRPVFGFKKAVGLTEDLVFGNLRLYPNPTSGLLYFDADVKGVLVRDLTGRIVVAFNDLNSDHYVDLSNLTEGMYFVRVQIDSLFKTYKVVVSK